MKEYDDVTLKKLQLLELEILKDLINVCEEFDLNYFAFAGTAIGAIRHKGFIPWDDDLDVGMPRKDYEKLLQVFNERYSDKYIIGNPEYMHNYPMVGTCIMIKGTKFTEEVFKDTDCDFGVPLDVLPFDNLPDEDNEFKKYAKRVWFWAHLLILRHMGHPNFPNKYRREDGKGKCVRTICMVVHWLLVLLRISPMWIYKRYKKTACRYNNVETERMGWCHSTNPYNDWITRSKAFPTMEVDFEDIKIRLPGDIDEYLHRIYGDYMQLPPPENRKNHFPYCLDFGDKA
ncbi:MAG: LicD family protein [Roseburia sp.]|nr:LicD family protein [Roseburia sp.]